VMNAAGMISFATFVLFAQEVLEVGPLLFTVLSMGGAIGGIVGGAFASAISRRLGSGTCLGLTLAGSAVLAFVIGLSSWWPVVFVMFTVLSLLGILWNVITVSLRQTIIPPHLLGRVNSVYRFFAWGMMPVGAALGGLVVIVVDSFASRDVALRATWIVNGAIHVLLFVFGRRKLTTARIEAARTAERVVD
jgi:MFS family permease